MKKLIILMIIALFHSLLQAQSTPLSSLYDRYLSKPGFETTEIRPGSMSFDWEKSMNNDQVKEMLQSVDNIRILSFKAGTENEDLDKTWKKMQKTAGDDLYTEVATVNAEKVQVDLYIIKGTEGKTREVAMLVKNDEGIMMLTVTGNMDFSAMLSPESIQSLREMGEYYMKDKGDCKPE